jgi:hypothetical protein
LRGVLNELNTLLDVALKALDASLQESLLLVGDTVKDVTGLLGTVGAKLDGSREELDTGGLDDLIAASHTGQVNESGLDDVLLALGGLDNSLGESETGESHGESSRASTVLGLDNLVTAELNTVDKSIVAVSGDLETGRDLAEQRNNGLAGVTTDDGDGGLGGVLQTGELLGESLGTNDVKGGDTEQTLGVENTGVLEDLGGNGDGGVDGVGDDQDESLGAILGDTLNEIADDAGVDLEEIITGHTGLAGNTGGDDNNISTGQGVLETIILGQEAGDFGNGGDVRKIGSDTGSVDNIVQGKLVNEGRGLQQKRKGLANTARSSENNSLDHDEEL